MAELPKPNAGSGNAVPSPQPNKVEWITEAEAEELAKMMNRRYIRKNADADAKKFYYRVLGLHKYEPASATASSTQFLLAANVQKFYRNKKRKVTVRDERATQTETQIDEQVVGHVQDNDGNPVCVDPTANFMMDARDFRQAFEIDAS